MIENIVTGLVYLILKHYTDKYNMYYIKSRTSYYDSSIHDTAISFSVFGTIMMLGCVLFYNVLRIGRFNLFLNDTY